ncbi:plasmid partitioning protein RepB [Aureimonas sp. AU40]|uniref:plasmid partitioning protein RepB n=1 Tax=Aureimonas sp. AU40 TaxID=1637747 RepID=UPI000782E6A9|nr:plasmid partitioning protein RepB [Aureimonas sp. AU40]
MSRRRDELKALLGGAPPAAETPAEADASAARPRAHASSGAVKAMGLALGNLRAEAEDARALREQVARGERVVEIDPNRIEPAFVADRLSQPDRSDEAFDALCRSIENGGQEVPVLLRPHPDAERAQAGWYQTAYGHRRVAAARALGIKVRAVVRPLSDVELVVAQGKENSERRDLSFIERALFAEALLQRGFERATVQSALSLHKAEMTRLLQVADAVPDAIARAIGPAPRAGRTRWMLLAEQLRTAGARDKAEREIATERFAKATSDERFVLMLERLTRRAKTASRTAEALSEPSGRVVASFKPDGKRSVIEFKGEGAFAAFVASEIPALYAAFKAREGED